MKQIKRSVRVVGVSGPSELLQLAESIAELNRSTRDPAAGRIELMVIGFPPSNTEELRSRLGDDLVLTGPLSHPQAIEKIATADVLACVLDEHRSRYRGLSSKLFEYLASDRPVIVINPTSEDRRLVRRYQGVFTLVRPDGKQVTEAVQAALKIKSRPAGEVQQFRQQYDRRNQVAQLAKWLEEIAG